MFCSLQATALIGQWRGVANFCCTVCEDDRFLRGLMRWDIKGGLNYGCFKEGGGGSLQPRYCWKFVNWLNDEMTTKMSHMLATRKIAELYREQHVYWHVFHPKNEHIHPKRSMFL